MNTRISCAAMLLILSSPAWGQGGDESMRFSLQQLMKEGRAAAQEQPVARPGGAPAGQAAPGGSSASSLFRPVHASAQAAPLTSTTPLPRGRLAAAEPKPVALMPDLPVASSEDDGVQVIEVTPGQNVVMDISVRELNRIITPFADPHIRTTSTAQFEVQDGVIYIATGSHLPITMYVTETDYEDVSLSLTLRPKRILPKEVRFVFDRDLSAVGSDYSHPGREREARLFEESDVHVQVLKELVRSVATAKALPPGYRLRPLRNGDPAVVCRIPALETTTAQAVQGARFTVMVSHARNASDRLMEIDESRCYANGVMAVAAYPTPYLQPGEQTELFVVFERRSKGPARSRVRPSLLSQARTE